MRRRSKVAIQVLVIAGIHLLVMIAFLVLLRSSVIPKDYNPSHNPLMHVVAGVYWALTSPAIWVVGALDRVGIRCSNALVIALIPLNSIVAASLLRAVYAGVQRLKRR